MFSKSENCATKSCPVTRHLRATESNLSCNGSMAATVEVAEFLANLRVSTKPCTCRLLVMNEKKKN